MATASKRKNERGTSQDLILLVKLHCPKDNICIPSVYKLQKLFSLSNTKTTRHHYCSKCFVSVDSTSKICKNCNFDLRNYPLKAYFLELPVEDQLRSLMCKPGFYNLKKHLVQVQKDDVYTDVHDRQQYKHHKLIQENRHRSLSFTWNTDGIPLYKSSTTSTWPLYLAINELSVTVHYQKENILYVGLWLGSKPKMN